MTHRLRRGTASLLALGLPAILPAQTLFRLPTTGCPMAHCDPRMSDNVNATIPVAAGSRIVYQDPGPVGSGAGLGCSSNGSVVACAYRNAVVAYDAAGARRFDSGALFGEWARTSAPIVGEDGSVIAADNQRLVRFSPGGAVVWQSPMPGGLPLSPVPTANRALVLATYGGPVSAFSLDNGRLLGTLHVRSEDGTRTYETLNTPAVRGNRAYVSMSARDDPANHALLVAIDVDPRNAESPLSVAWQFPFAGPSGASPLVLSASSLVIFDADRLNPGEGIAPQLAAVRDDGGSPTLVWRRALRSPVRASAARDPRGGIWFFSTGAPYLHRLVWTSGQGWQRIDLDALIGEEGLHVPSSALTIGAKTDAHATVMLVGAVAVDPPGASYVAAIDLEAQALLWKVRIAGGRAEDYVASQFAVVNASGGPRVAFPTSSRGLMLVGEP